MSTRPDPSQLTQCFVAARDTVQPGDFAVVNTGTKVTSTIEFWERVDDMVTRQPQGGWDKWDHAVVCAGVSSTGSITIVEAEPGGARLVPWHYEDRPHQWSSGIIGLTSSQRAVISSIAAQLVDSHTGYGWLDYLALVMHALHLPAPGLRDFIRSGRTLICSQLVDYCYKRAGKELFTDGRWDGYVKPSDLGYLLR